MKELNNLEDEYFWVWNQFPTDLVSCIYLCKPLTVPLN